MDVSLKQLEEAIDLKRQITQLQTRLNSILGISAAVSTPRSFAPSSGRRGRRRGLSAAGRARIAAAARARWARAKAAGGATAAASTATRKKCGSSRRQAPP